MKTEAKVLVNYNRSCYQQAIARNSIVEPVGYDSGIRRREQPIAKPHYYLDIHWILSTG